MSRADALVGVGLLCVGGAVYLLVGWAGVLALCGFVLVAAGAAEARRAK